MPAVHRLRRPGAEALQVRRRRARSSARCRSTRALSRARRSCSRCHASRASACASRSRRTRELSTRAGRRYAQAERGRRDRRRRSRCEDKDLVVRASPSGPRALVCKVDEINELAGPGKGVTVIKVDDGRPRGRRHRRAAATRTRRIVVETREGHASSTLHAGASTRSTAPRRQGPRDVAQGRGEGGGRAQSRFIPLPEQTKD